MVRTSAFMLVSFTAALGGLVYASRLGSIATDIDVGNLVPYAVIGGTSLFGGRGKMIHALLGGVVIATAIVLILAVTVDSLVRRRGVTDS